MRLPLSPAVQMLAATRTAVAVFPQRDAGLTLEWNDFSAYTKDGGGPAHKGGTSLEGDQLFSSTAVHWLALNHLLSFKL